MEKNLQKNFKIHSFIGFKDKRTLVCKYKMIQEYTEFNILHTKLSKMLFLKNESVYMS